MEFTNMEQPKELKKENGKKKWETGQWRRYLLSQKRKGKVRKKTQRQINLVVKKKKKLRRKSIKKMKSRMKHHLENIFLFPCIQIFSWFWEICFIVVYMLKCYDPFLIIYIPVYHVLFYKEQLLLWESFPYQMTCWIFLRVFWDKFFDILWREHRH